MLNETRYSNAVGERARRLWHAVPPKARQRIKRSIHPARAAKIKRTISPRPSVHNGVVSVIVPIYNVEQFLDDCLASIVRQSYQYLEIILVDDGSTDGSSSIARGYERADPRVRLVSKKNAGLGAARNTGVQYATGRFIAFVDSDDVLPVGAYKTMVDSLTTSGSDFAIGSFRRFNSKRRWLPPIPARVHSSDRIGVNIDEYSDILYDVFAWNKLFTREFWSTQVRSFPEGVLYEDKEPMVAAYLRAKAFDVLHSVVYEWRVREDGSSITQQKHRLKDLQDRMRVAAGVNRLMEQSATEPVRQVMAQVVFGVDLGVYYAQAPRTDDEYWRVLQEGVSGLASLIDVETMSNVHLHARILTELVVAGARRDLETVLVDQQVNGQGYEIVVDGDGFKGSPAYLSALDTSIKPETLILTQQDFETITGLTGYSWTSDSALDIRGYAYISGFDLDTHSSEISVSLISSRNGNVISVPTEHLPRDPRIDENSGDPRSSYANSGFCARIDAASFLADLPDQVCAADEWRVMVSVCTAGVSVKSRLQKRDTRGSAGTFQTGALVGGSRIVGDFRAGTGLVLRKEVATFVVSDWSLNGRVLGLEVEALGDEVARRLNIDSRTLRRTIGVAPAQSTSDGVVRFAITVPNASKRAQKSKERLWRIRIETAKGSARPIAWRDTSDGVLSRIGSTAGPQLAVTKNGNVAVRDRNWRMEVTDFNVSKASLRVHCTASLASDGGGASFDRPRLVLASDNDLVEPTSVEWNSATGEFLVAFPIDGGAAWNADGPPSAGLYTLRCITADDGSLTDSYWIPVHAQLQKTLPTDVLLEKSRLRLSRTPQAAALAVHYSAPLRPSERGALHQRVLRSSIDLSQAKEKLGDAVLFQSFFGSTVSDSGKAIFEELRARDPHRLLYWAVKDHSIRVPEGAVPVLVNSREWHEALAGAGTLVNNGNFPEYFRKRPHQFYIQTWHGTPLKKIGNDVPAKSLSLSYRRLMRREAEQYWDVLLAQGEFAAQTLSRAFDYGGKVLTTGSPRNDVLASAVSEEKFADVRERLGVRANQKIVLYAPTWRDNVKVGQQYGLVSYLDFEKTHKLLGDDVVFLLRGHQNTAAQRSVGAGPHYIDVTTYPDINDLLIVADVLVTDYSSVMFDFCVTKKPIIFLAPDLELYRDSVRGFYFDFEDVAPGPVVGSTEEVVDALMNAEENAVVYARKYADFRRRFAPYDDGGAAGRVLDEVSKINPNEPFLNLRHT